MNLVNSCVILAGGKSSRMGRDKSLLPFGEFDSLIEYQYSRMKNIFDEVFISTKYNKFSFKAKLIVDNSNIFSPMMALKTILRELKKPCFIMAVDMPFVSNKAILKLLKNFDNNFDIIVSCHQKHLEPLCAIYNQSILKNVDDLISKDIHKLNYLIKISNTKRVYFEDEEIFNNLNYFSDYIKALEISNQTKNGNN